MDAMIQIQSITEFDEQLNLPNRVLFVVLGDIPDCKRLADEAAAMSDNWRYTIWAKQPAAPKLSSTEHRISRGAPTNHSSSSVKIGEVAIVSLDITIWSRNYCLKS